MKKTEKLSKEIKLKSSQQSLGIKTYQSDLFNNWLSTEWMKDNKTCSTY